MRRDPLTRYRSILKSASKPLYLEAKALTSDYDPACSDEELWAEHDRLMALQKLGTKAGKGNRSFLELKVELSRRLSQRCAICERRCGVDRTKGEAGKCGVVEPRIASAFIHRGEEEALVPSYTVFFSGCNLECVYCQNYDISTNPLCGEVASPSALAESLDLLEGKARNVNWVGGDPIPDQPYILDVLNHMHAPLPQIWNSNMYMSEKALRLLAGAMDLYLTDFKYGNDDCAYRLSKVPRYFEFVSRNHLLAYEQGEVIVRHLLLPGHMECCTKPIIGWLADNTPNVLLNLMAQYHPEHRAREYPELRRTIKAEEYREACSYACERGLELT